MSPQVYFIEDCHTTSLTSVPTSSHLVDLVASFAPPSQDHTTRYPHQAVVSCESLDRS